MPLYVKDPQVDALADELAALARSTKTEAVRQALQNEIAREKGKADLVEQSVAFVRQLKQRAGSGPGQPVDKALIDSLYGEGR
ncbi:MULTISPECIES: type II toxin-antitoxin system VapB family antitoxin [Methylorubrum]|uniref:type II toxin-antitoxin system VapB family antitoxin n=1 Tax=Methylorubrum TaxID=2282523 RepID=UPI001AE6D8F2|nr:MULTISPECIES: type II toxin-antitoxin system VapB family antitoxin [Methylorubrum]MCJ2032074.1 type II toxin-antitoxin system VapB family antitoxin [Methylobacterium sp. J-043]MCP1535584.1 antitoxin VapB [Methylorubrum extorquens]MCP1551546.1 antitoxin VapB [Methylorubrum zatmanii]MCP1556483.1 antitoxin VapB [Methylorubrum extorquens]MCP1581856.1 antitoxin VapB [Methylorubrum extorquens]